MTETSIEKGWSLSFKNIRLRLGLLVQDFVSRLWSRTTAESAKELEEDIEYEWVTMGDGNVCPICEPNSGKRYTQKEYDALEFPAHYNCRCWVIVHRKNK